MSIKLKGSSDGSVSLDAPADTSPTGTDVTLILPTSAGSANQFLQNSGTAGTLEYSSMIEDSSGQVGIGTTSADTALHVKGTASSQLTIERDGSGSQIAGIIFKDGSGDQNRISCSDQAIRFAYGSGNAESMRILSGGGITFNGDTAAANALHDYEEGTFTPTDASGAGLTFTTAAAVYTKIGRMVYTQFRVVYPSTSNGTAAAIGGFPFTPANGGAAISNGSNASGVGYATSTAIPQIHMSASETKTNFFNGTAAMSNANFSTRELRFGVVYITAA